MKVVDEPIYCHVCPDGHTWIEQADGGVSPSYGYGGTSHTWPGYEPRTCPEPRRVDDHGYRCVCGQRWFAGGCGCKRWKPPKPVCLKPPAATFAWVTYNPRRKNEPHGWIDITVRQLAFDSATSWAQPADAIRDLRSQQAVPA